MPRALVPAEHIDESDQATVVNAEPAPLLSVPSASSLENAKQVAMGAEYIVLRPQRRLVDHQHFGVLIKEERTRTQALLSREAEYKDRMARLHALRGVLERYVGHDEAKDIVVLPKQLHVDNDLCIAQRYVPEMDMRDQPFQIRGGYAELRKEGAQDTATYRGLYQRMNEVLVQNVDTGRFDPQVFHGVQQSPQLRELLDASERIPPLKEFLGKLVPAMIAYSNEAVHEGGFGDILDTAGPKNIIVFQKGDGEYTARFVDPLHANPDTVPLARIAIDELRQGKKMTPGLRPGLLNAFNYAMTINGIAATLGLPDRFHLVPPGQEAGTLDVRGFLEETRRECLATGTDNAGPAKNIQQQVTPSSVQQSMSLSLRATLMEGG